MPQNPLLVIINIDGGARGNPGPAGAGVVIRTADDNTTIHASGKFLGKATNNIAEYSALLAGMEAAAKLNATELEILSDSELLVKQMNGEYRVKNEGLRPLFERANVLIGQFNSCTIKHIGREENTVADGLVNRAINLGRDVEE